MHGSNKAGVEREAANQGRDGLVPAQLSERERERERVGKLTIVLFSQTHLKININTQKVLMGDGFIKTEPHK